MGRGGAGGYQEEIPICLGRRKNQGTGPGEDGGCVVAELEGGGVWWEAQGCDLVKHLPPWGSSQRRHLDSAFRGCVLVPVCLCWGGGQGEVGQSSQQSRELETLYVTSFSPGGEEKTPRT